MAVWECGNGDGGDHTPPLTLLHLHPHILQQLVVERVCHVELVSAVCVCVCVCCVHKCDKHVMTQI